MERWGGSQRGVGLGSLEVGDPGFDRFETQPERRYLRGIDVRKMTQRRLG